MGRPPKAAIAPTPALNDETEQEAPAIRHRVPMTPEAAEARAAKEERMREEAKAEASVSTGAPRRVRKPFGRTEQKLAVPQRPGFHRRWFNDQPGRVMRAQEAGYEHVKDKDSGKPMSLLGGKDDRGDPVLMYLMEIPQEYYDEDKLAKIESLNETNKSLYTGRKNEFGSDPNIYVPGDVRVGERIGNR